MEITSPGLETSKTVHASLTVLFLKEQRTEQPGIYWLSTERQALTSLFLEPAAKRMEDLTNFDSRRNSF